MTPTVPLSAHEKRKKELLVLGHEQLMLIVLLVLNKNETDLYSAESMLRNASLREPSIGSWSTARLQRQFRMLVAGGFVRETYRGYTLESTWLDTAVFAADGLGVNRLDTLVEIARQHQEYPERGQPIRHWRRDYEDVTQRCIHKILLGKSQDFDQLYRELSQTLIYEQFSQQSGRSRINRIIRTVDWSFWKKRPPYFQWSALCDHQLSTRHWTETLPQELLSLMEPLFQRPDATDFREEVSSIAFMGMHFFRERPTLFAPFPGVQGLIALQNGAWEDALACFEQHPAHDQEDIVGIVDLFKLMLGYREQRISAADLKAATFHFRISDHFAAVNATIALGLFLNEDAESAEEILFEQFQEEIEHPIDWLVVLCVAAWMGIKLRKSWVDPIYEQLDTGALQYTPFLEEEVIAVLRTLFPRRQITLSESNLYSSDEGGGAQVPKEVATQKQAGGKVLSMLPVRPTWEYALRQLQAPVKQRAVEEHTPAFRTIWIVDFDTAEIYCKEQKQGKRGWSKGRKLKWYELLAPKHPDAMHAADTEAIAGLETRDGRRPSSSLTYNDDALQVNFGRMLYALTGHPRVYLGEDKRIPIELFKGEPELQITDTEEGMLLRFDPSVEAAGYVWKKETPTRYRIYHLTDDQARMAWAIGDGITVPADQRPVVENLTEDLRPLVAVQSSFDLIDEDLERMAGNPQPCFHLLPFGEGYKIELYVKPLPDEAFYFKPADGLPRSVIELEDGRRVLERDLELEQEEAAAAILACPTLARTPQQMYEWVVEDTTTALRILLELRRLVAEQTVTIEHPKGEKLKITGEVGSNDLAIRVGKNRDWFEVDGKLTVDEEKVLRLQAIFEHLRINDNPFVELAEGEFVALTDELRDRILEMEGLLHRKGKKLQLPGLAAGAFEQVTEGLDDLEFDLAWTESLERIRAAKNIRPRLPKDFRAELRDYQKEGFRWMMRLAAWGVGGCLADDMGLGKTVQALAVLSARAAEGPALVIAPASVTRNWRRETERFAPGLIPVLIASRADTALLPQLGTGDLALVSYGLLPFIGEELQAMAWSTIILDEAQAIKNAATKRAKIVQDLQGDFKLATTGTPIENHLGELWSLFRFLNPGLLSSKASFNEKYNKPIARDGDEERRLVLKKLVQPFILRRRKDQVLTELPPKTEVLLEVNLSEEEKALYEAMRRQAVEQIAQADEQSARFTVLAQLTKLRQAACHPRLVRPNSRLGSAKLELVGATLLEILEGGHKALVFSQFVKHLKIVENWVKGQGIAYQYLDGSTPGKQREVSVNAFQEGEGEVFLISLKAGGTGLNLTAADYVLHLDPWWNPAAEDQASDRAHRIGQQHPVTVYRFVSQGTIEEQIIALHAEKRDLADQILSGTGNAGNLKVEEILAMIATP